MRRSILVALSVTALLLFASGRAPRQPGVPVVPVVAFDRLDATLGNPGDTTFIINFWATWCKPCIMELPEFERIEAEYADDPLVRVLLVSLDFPEKLDSQVIPFLRNRDIRSEVWLLDEADANSWIDRVDPSWSGALPATVIVNDSYRYFHEGMMNYHELDSIISKHRK